MKLNQSRRNFIRQAGCAALGSSTMFSTLLNLKALSASAAANSDVFDSDDYKALICIVLNGGNDSFNMLIPTSGSEYASYRTTRSNLAISSDQILSLNATGTGGRTFGVHSAMPNIRSMFNNGDLAFIANVGTLVEPVSVAEFWSESKAVPLGLLSHSDQLQQWQTALPHERSGIGWGGRMADLINDMAPSFNTNQIISMNVSLNGSNIFQTGNRTIEYAVDPNAGAREIIGYNDDWLFESLRKQAIDNMLEQNYSDIFKQTYVNVLRNSKDAFQEFNTAISGIQLQNQFPQDNWNIGQSFAMIARTIAARNTLGFKRQTFYVDFPGWDHHDEVLVSQRTMLEVLDNAIFSFQNEMESMGTKDCVVSFLVSDFARTLTSNGNGTDHAWGGNVFAVGGRVKGQRIYGQYPETLSLDNNPDDLGGGILLPSTSADMYFAELAHWFGVPKSDLATIFPNLYRFYDTSSSDLPIDFLTLS
jgi:uncharacterized protein (DUF1501 family)